MSLWERFLFWEWKMVALLVLVWLFVFGGAALLDR